MERYYDLIVSLIKNHRKYPGCESILDDIVQDVYAHAGAIIDSVSDDNVIATYLTKIVSTSMITVPKKFGIVPQRMNRQSAERFSAVSDILNSQSPKQVEPEPVEQVSLQSEPEVIAEITEEPKEDELQSTEVEPLRESKVDLTLVDKMINGVDVKSEDNESVSSDEDSLEDDLIENLEELTVADVMELDNTQPQDVIEDSSDNLDNFEVKNEEILQEEAPLEEVSEFDLDNAEDSAELIDSEEESIQEELPTEEITDFDLQVTDSAEDSLVEELDLPEQEEISDSIEEEDSLEEISPVEEFDNNITEELEDSEQEEASTQEENISEVDQRPIYKIMDFSVETETDSVDCEEILNELVAFDKKHPEKQSLKICELKYKENLSVKEISEELSITEEEVLDTLNEIIYLVKD